MDRLDWANRALRLLASHYKTAVITVFLDNQGGVTLCVHGLGLTIGVGLDLGTAIQTAIKRLTDEEILAAGGLL